ncbi:MAG: WhiB family transcriptional regulator [Mycobacteriaceae bacterium]|nr:WhiB family transcriptional regulator [Mycobacteriaceae bacterium]
MNKINTSQNQRHPHPTNTELPQPIHRQPWYDQAACQGCDTNAWYTDQGPTPETRMAKRVCQHCPVADQCLELALANNDHYGIWGGYTPRQRRNILRHRNLGQTA